MRHSSAKTEPPISLKLSHSNLYENLFLIDFEMPYIQKGMSINSRWSQMTVDLSKIDYSVERRLNRDLLSQLVTCDFILDKKNLSILGAAGSGKSFFAKAFGVEACHNLHRTKYFNANRFLNDLYDLSIQDQKRYKRKLGYYQRLPVLILDDWLMFPINNPVKESILLDLIDARYGQTTTIVCSQVDPDDWCEKFSGYTVGNAITSRLVSNGFSLVIQCAEDLRQTKYPGVL